MTGIVVNHYHPRAARFLLNAHWHVRAIYLRLSLDANLHLGGALAEPLHVLNLVRSVLNSHENASRPVQGQRPLSVPSRRSPNTEPVA